MQNTKTIVLTLSPQLSSSLAAVPQEPILPLHSVNSVPAVAELWEMSLSAKPVLKSSTTAMLEPLGKILLFSNRIQCKRTLVSFDTILMVLLSSESQIHPDRNLFNYQIET